MEESGGVGPQKQWTRPPDLMLLKQPSIILTMRFLFLSPLPFDVDFIINGRIWAGSERRQSGPAGDAFSARPGVAGRTPGLLVLHSPAMKTAVRPPLFVHQAFCYLIALQHSIIFTHTQGCLLPPEAGRTVLKQTLGTAELADGDSGLAVN